MNRRFQIRLILFSITLLMVANALQGQRTKANAQNGPFTYLPIIVGGSNNIPNGDFEAGRTIWTESSRWSNILIVPDEDLPVGISVHNGNWAAWLGGDNDELAAIEQSVFITPSSPLLTYWHWIDWPFSCQGATGAEAQISVNQTIVFQTDVCINTDTGGWVQQTVDLGAFSDQTVNLRFQLVTGNNSFANWFLDDISLQNAP